MSLWSRDGQTVGEIGKALKLESNTLTPLLKRLEATGLISRARDPKDERQVRIRLTEKGRDLRAQAEHIPGCLADALGFSQAEIDDLRHKIVIVQERLQAIADKTA